MTSARKEGIGEAGEQKLHFNMAAKVGGAGRHWKERPESLRKE